ncbi:MAG: hypothetical protein M0Z48_04900 [Nitrospiraceae bacterium]|nr:hypothetical protein [Nitrospiraceae bacterium]
MTPTEKISTESGIVLFIQKRIWEDQAEMAIRAEGGQERFVLHWGFKREPGGPWEVPPERNWPIGSNPFDHAAIQTLLDPSGGEITIKIDLRAGFRFLDFALFFPAEGHWDNNLGRNYRIELPGPIAPPASPGTPAPGPLEGRMGDIDFLAREIIQKEMGQNSWTLMHRFNLCCDLLDKVGENDIEGLALIYVWLRFSALRQLDWQRNYNTKPRELGHALDRLSTKLAVRYQNAPGGKEREMIRLIMGTLGRGSDAQRVRDEVLAIMHRHHIKEVSGHFMEEWHQKLHNNTTPDDIVICEAYLDFLRNDGNTEVFYRRLREGGVTKARLESYERPIKSPPDFIPALKDALIHEFGNFLNILKAVHSGTDLDAAIAGARGLLDPETAGVIDSIRQPVGLKDQPVRPEGKTSEGRTERPLLVKGVKELAEKIIRARRLLAERPGKHFSPGEMRNLLFLDMALEDHLRVLIERNLEAKIGPEDMVSLISLALENVCLSSSDAELDYSLKFWRRLEKGELPLLKKAWALRAEAARERIGRAIGAFAARMYDLLDPKARYLGEAFRAEPWTIKLFSEEVLRGRPAFALSALIGLIDPVLRKTADIGDWQIISRGHGERGRASGEVMVVRALRDIQGQDFPSPKVIVTDEIHGDEEIPAGVSAIITSSFIDRLSHLAIRARNAGVFFATCFDQQLMGEIKSAEGRNVGVRLAAAGLVSFEAAQAEPAQTVPAQAAQAALRNPVRPRGMTAVSPPEYAVAFADFTEKNVGYKSINLRRLFGKLPDWINLPASLAIPFGVFEKTLGLGENREAEKRYRQLEEALNSRGEGYERTLEGLRKTTLELLNPPAGLEAALKDKASQPGLALPAWDEAWTCIKRVWASKWNDRAYLSRKTNGIRHQDIFMSVLIQGVVEAEAGFVIHTVNPFTLDPDEIYAEAVLGLGETLAGSYPGLSLGFTFRKEARRARIRSIPSKSAGLFGQKGGLIFRSDSNGEDLAGYAGAGLYDSFILPPPNRATLDYTGSRFVWDEEFLMDFTHKVARIGLEVEKAMGGAQDIEGAFVDTGAPGTGAHGAGARFYVVQARPEVL